MPDIHELMKKFKSRYEGIKKSYELHRMTFGVHAEDYKKLQSSIKTLGEELRIKKLGIDSLNDISKIYEQFSIRRKIEAVITNIIRVLFCQDNFKFAIQRKTIRNQQEVELLKSENRDGFEYFTPLANNAGGINDIVDIIIRVLVIQTFPENRRLLILDEPLKNLSKELRPRFFDFFRKLCDEFKIQYILVTHEDEYMGDSEMRYHFSYDGNKTVVECESSTNSKD